MGLWISFKAVRAIIAFFIDRIKFSSLWASHAMFSIPYWQILRANTFVLVLFVIHLSPMQLLAFTVTVLFIANWSGGRILIGLMDIVEGEGHAAEQYEGEKECFGKWV